MPDETSPEFLALQSAVAGRYSLERELGRGGMGVVFLARDVALDRLVAIKLLPPAQAASPDLRERFLREARTAAKLSHPNIVPIFAVEEVGTFVFFVMAYVEGETLGERVRKRSPLTPAAAARMLQEVAWALAYAHLRGVVHRDVKPDNILLERETGRALVTDFGIARAEAPTGLTGVGEILGTAQYMSPEQACGETVDGRSDLYSLGVVGFFALSGRLPFDAPNTAALLAMHLTRPAPPLATVAPGVPGRLAQAIDRCLAKNPADRFPSGEALAEAVAETTSVTKETPTPIRLWMQRGEGARMLIGVWTGIGVFGVIAALAQAHLPSVGSLLVTFGPAAGYGLYKAQYTQRVLAAGYTLEDIRLALRDKALQQREELAFESAAEPSLIAKIVRKLTFAAFGVAVGSGLLLAVLPWTWDWMNMGGVIMGLWTAFGLGTLGTLTGALIGQAVPGRRVAPKDPLKSLRVRVWGSRLGEWFTRIASLGMDRKALPAASAHRPTEIAIGLAASALFESLPKGTRKSLPDLPDVLRRLEADAQAMRRRVDEMNEALASLGEGSLSGKSTALRDGGGDIQAAVADQQEKLRADLRVARDQAAGRLATAVAALENIRLDLLRLKAGAGTVAELSANLTEARRLAAEVDAQVAGRMEVERVLRRDG
ncbi:MAG: serine/threonine-protein kinase [Gemmatimonadota bacterium]